MKVLISVLFLFSFATKSWSFNKENHRLITERAIELLLEKYGEDYLSQKEIKEIINGNLSEERLNLKSIIRPYNKHYINVEKDSTLWQRNNSIDVRFDRLVAMFYAQHNTSGFDRSIGEIIHFIQDAASPSHVVPIDHVEKNDAFDSQPIDSLLPTVLMEEKFLQCTMDYPQFLLMKISSKTLENIEDKFPVTITSAKTKYEDSLSWNVFWQKDSANWFGDYGMLGKPSESKSKDNFLKEEIVVDGINYHIKPSVYREFSRRQLDLAVLYTARFIYFAKSLINEDGEVITGAEG